jgi:hypothetical protein
MPGEVCNFVMKSGRHMGLPLLLLLLNGCAANLFNGYQRSPAATEIVPVSWFQTDTGHFLFNTKIDLLNNHFSGLMVVKPVSTDNYRVVFITETGLKIFDMEFFPDKEVKVHYVMDAMNKKALIKTLSSDISLVLMNRLLCCKPILLKDKHSGDTIYKYHDQKKRNYYFMEGTKSKPSHVKQASWISNKVSADFYGSESSGIDSIRITHNNFRLSIYLFRIIEETNHAAE